MTPFDRAMEGIDAANAADPTRIDVMAGHSPPHVVYAQRMTRMLNRVAPDASAELRLAARAQHLRRWTVPRDSYPMDRAGYHRWRNDLKRLHAQWAREILQASGVDEAVTERAASLIAKENLKYDREAQTLEDVACLVFLQYYAADFAAAHSPEKMTGILRKTWAKMSAGGRVNALKLSLDPAVAALVAATLSASAGGTEGLPGSSAPAATTEPDLRDVAVVLAAHGDRGGSAPNATLFRQTHALAAELTCLGVMPGVLKGEPSFEDAVRAAVAAGARAILIYPLFMADGYFTRTILPQRLHDLLVSCPVRILDPLGLDPHLPALLMEDAIAAAERAGYAPATSRLLLVGHGSQLGPASADATRAAAAAMALASPFQRIDTAFLEEPPLLDDALTGAQPPTVILGFFSGDGLHAAEDVPEALAESGAAAVYAGSIGQSPRLAGLMASAIRDHVQRDPARA